MTQNLEYAEVIGEELALSFSDDMELFIGLPVLRRGCPCAGCQGEPDALGRIVKPLVEYTESSFQISEIVTVGSYAVQLFWKDGHSSGIYSYSYLTRLSVLQNQT